MCDYSYISSIIISTWHITIHQPLLSNFSLRSFPFNSDSEIICDKIWKKDKLYKVT